MLYPHVLAEVVVKGWSIGLQISLKPGYFYPVFFQQWPFPASFGIYFSLVIHLNKWWYFCRGNRKEVVAFWSWKEKARHQAGINWHCLAQTKPKYAQRYKPRQLRQSAVTLTLILPNRLILFTLKIHQKLNIKWQWVVRHILSLSPEKDPNP